MNRMQDRLQFNDLESTVRFLNKRLIDPRFDFHLVRYHIYYLLQATMVLRAKDGLFTIHFCGTNHSRDPTERLNIDSLLANVSAHDVVLIECGQGTLGYCQNSLVDDLKRKIEERLQIKGVNRDELFKSAQAEMTYATNLALSKGARAKNMDTTLNPEALKFIADRYGINAVIKELNIRLRDCFETPHWLNNYIRILLKNIGIHVELKDIVKQQPRNVLAEKSALSYPDRDDYMTSEILKELSNPLYAIAHTMHIKEILRRLKKKVEIIDFSATLVHNSTEYNWARPTENDSLWSRGYAKQKLEMYKLVNWVLYKIS